MEINDFNRKMLKIDYSVTSKIQHKLNNLTEASIIKKPGMDQKYLTS